MTTKQNDMVTIFCYGKKEQMNRQEAIKLYTQGVVACEGSEKSRYANILADLLDGQDIAIDDYEEYRLLNKTHKCKKCGKDAHGTNQDMLCPDCIRRYNVTKYSEISNTVRCPYCGSLMPNTGNVDELCDDCKQTFGHSLVTEL